MSFERWAELEPIGPHAAGSVGGDIQSGEAFSRRWARPMPAPRRGWMVIAVTSYACEDNGRRWIQAQIEFARVTSLLDELDPSDMQVHDSVSDGPASEPWPTENDVKADLASYDINIHNAWDGS